MHVRRKTELLIIRNFISKLGRKNSGKYLARLQDIFTAPNVEGAHLRKHQLVEKLHSVRLQVAQWLEEEIVSCFLVYNLAESHRKQMRSTNMLERLMEELMSRSRVIRIFPNNNCCLRMMGTLLIEQSEEWEIGRSIPRRTVRR